MPSKKHILQRLGELKKQMEILENDINEHYNSSDLFPDKKFIFTKINGIEYISKDIHEMIIKDKIKGQIGFLKYFAGTILLDRKTNEELVNMINDKILEMEKWQQKLN